MSHSFDTVFARPVAESTVGERLQFLRRVYGWMTAALVMTVIGAAISIESGLTQRLLFSSGWIGAIVLTLAWMGIGWLAMKVRHTPTVNVLAFAAYALFTGFVVSGIVLVAMLMGDAIAGSSMTYVYQALGLTVVVFGGLTVYTFFTKRDFSFLSGILFVGLLALIVLGIVNIFVQSSVFSLVVSFLGVLLFSGYVLYDTQQVMRTYPGNEHLAGAMTLFIDFVMLFMHILRMILILAGGNRE